MRTLQDSNFMTWEAFVSTGKQGFANDPHVVFQCRTLPGSRPRWAKAAVNDASDAQGDLMRMSDADLRALFERSVELP